MIIVNFFYFFFFFKITKVSIISGCGEYEDSCQLNCVNCNKGFYMVNSEKC
jgi:hypothetical protein